jgi:hypothetical protein
MSDRGNRDLIVSHDQMNGNNFAKAPTKHQNGFLSQTKDPL